MKNIPGEDSRADGCVAGDMPSSGTFNNRKPKFAPASQGLALVCPEGRAALSVVKNKTKQTSMKRVKHLSTVLEIVSSSLYFLLHSLHAFKDIWLLL